MSLTRLCLLGILASLAPAIVAGDDADRRRQGALLREVLENAEVARNSGDLDVAEREFREALSIAEQFGPRSLYLARAADGLADVHRRAGRYEEAVPLYLRAIPLWQSLLGATQPRLAVSLHNLGTVYLELDRPAAAGPVLEQALSIWTATYGADSNEARNTERAIARQRLTTGTR